MYTHVHSASKAKALRAMAVILAATSAFAQPPRVPTRYAYPTIDVPFGVPGQDLDMQIVWINNAGVSVGADVLADGSIPAFRWENGESRTIDPPAGGNASASSINNAGVILGVFVNPNGLVTGYRQDGHEVTEFAVPDATYTIPNFLNDRGQIAGTYGDANGVAHGFVATPRRGLNSQR